MTTLEDLCSAINAKRFKGKTKNVEIVFKQYCKDLETLPRVQPVKYMVIGAVFTLCICVPIIIYYVSKV